MAGVFGALSSMATGLGGAASTAGGFLGGLMNLSTINKQLGSLGGEQAQPSMGQVPLLQPPQQPGVQTPPVTTVSGGMAGGESEYEKMKKLMALRQMGGNDFLGMKGRNM
jgi:hypothetical protein